MENTTYSLLQRNLLLNYLIYKLTYSVARTQGIPMPRNTFTLLLPVMLPILASAFSSWAAAAIEAKVSGRLWLGGSWGGDVSQQYDGVTVLTSCQMSGLSVCVISHRIPHLVPRATNVNL